MSPLGRTNVWRGILRSVAMADMVYPSGTVGTWSPHGAGLATVISVKRRRSGSGSTGSGPYCAGSGSLELHALSSNPNAIGSHRRAYLISHLLFTVLRSLPRLPHRQV